MKKNGVNAKMSVRKKFTDAREEPRLQKELAGHEQFLACLVRDLPAKMAAEIAKIEKGAGDSGHIFEVSYANYDTFRLKDFVRLPSYQTLHKLLSNPEVDVCIKTLESAKSSDRDDRAFVLAISMDQPYSRSNHKPHIAAITNANNRKNTGCLP